MTGRRWNVEVRPNQFDDVGAAYLHITEGGVIAFMDDDDNCMLAYAPHQWLTVSISEDDAAAAS